MQHYIQYFNLESYTAFTTKVRHHHTHSCIRNFAGSAIWLESAHLLPSPAKMPKFFCDYCDVYLTHDSMSVRRAHNSGRNHLRNVVEYYQQIGQEKAQSVIDSITSAYGAEGQTAPGMMGAGMGVMAGAPGVGAPPGGGMGGFPGAMPSFGGPPMPGAERVRHAGKERPYADWGSYRNATNALRTGNATASTWVSTTYARADSRATVTSSRLSVCIQFGLC